MDLESVNLELAEIDGQIDDILRALRNAAIRLVREVEAIRGSIFASASCEQMSYTYDALKCYAPEDKSLDYLKFLVIHKVYLWRHFIRLDILGRWQNLHWLSFRVTELLFAWSV